MTRILVNEYYVQIIADSSDKQFLEFLSFAHKNGILVDKQRKRNTYHCSLRALPEILQQLRPGLSIENAPKLIQEKYRKEIICRERTDLLKQYGPDNIHPFLWTHQQLGVELAEVNDRYGFFYDTRTGKTAMAYQIIENAIRSGAKRAVVICPSSIIQSWINDAKMFPNLKVAAYYGTAANKYEALHTPCHVMLWSMGLAVDSLELIKAAKFDLCFIDESSKLKSHRAQISKAMLELSLHIPKWYCLSATPAPNGEQEYYTQIKTIDPYAFSDAVSHFENRYFDDFSRSNKYKRLVIKPYMKEEFDNLVAKYAIYVDQSVMPTAGKKWHMHEFELAKELQSLYDSMRMEMNAIVGEQKNITVDMSVAMRAKLNQISSGFIMDTDTIIENKLLRLLGEDATGQEVFRLSNYRIVELDKLLKTFGNNKVVIWANYKEEFRMISELLGSKARYIRGGCSIQDKEEYISKFKQGSLQYLVCHPLSVGMGINLTEAHIAIYYSITDSWEALKQSSERIAGHITVQPEECHYYIMQAAGTVNSLIYDNIAHKRDASYGLLEHLEARYER